MENKKEIIKKFRKIFRHEADYPVVGGAVMCAKCGEQNYETECCSNNIDWTVEEEAIPFILKALEKQKSDLVKEIEKLEVIDTANSALNSPNDYMEKGAYMFKNQILEVLNK